MNYESMTDRELDELVIDKVMGWKDRMLITSDGKTSIAESNEREFISLVRLFNPSTNMRDAWEVVETMRKKGICLTIETYGDFFNILPFRREKESLIAVAVTRGPSVTRSISIAALKAVTE